MSKILWGAILILMVVSCSYYLPSGNSLIKSSDSLPHRLSYFRPDELINGEKQGGTVHVPKGGRLIYKGIHYHNKLFDKGDGSSPFLRVSADNSRKKVKCRQWSTVMTLDPVTTQIKSKITCDVLDSLPSHFEVELREDESKALETFEVFPESLLSVSHK
jgi:hypothetical protein